MGCVCSPTTVTELTVEGDVRNPDVTWKRLGGEVLEEPIAKGWVALVRADWLVQLAQSGGVLTRRQQLPAEAFVGVEELKEAGPGVISGANMPGVDGEWLRVIVLSYPWLQPGHPDPHGENLRKIAKMLELYVQDSFAYVNGGKPYGVLIDFTALPQGPRSEEENDIFKLALPCLNLFYAHPNTVVLKVTAFPEGYPNDSKNKYELPAGANTVAYAERGWCFAESAMAGLVKDSNKILDLGVKYNDKSPQLWWAVNECKTGRPPPLHPSEFKMQLDMKTFTSKKGDFDKVASLYAGAFERHLEGAKELEYAGLGWKAEELRKTLQAIKSNAALQSLSLSFNKIGVEGAKALAQSLKDHEALEALDLMGNGISDEGVTALGQALSGNLTFKSLNLKANNIGPEGMAALGSALKTMGLQSLILTGNFIEEQGAQVLAEFLKDSTTLQSLDLWSCMVGNTGAASLGEALKTNRSLQTLNLGYNGIRSDGTAALGQSLKDNNTLLSLGLERNRLDAAATSALSRATRWTKLTITF